MSLTNQDFKAMLLTPRAERDGSTPRSAPKSDAGTRSKPVRVKTDKHHRGKKTASDWKAHMEEQKKLKERYRDRADERRKEKFKEVETGDATVLGEATGLEGKEISVNDSKFLGGDERYTHLVKGLDFALLQKVKGELTAQEMQKQQEEEEKRKAEEAKQKSQTPTIRTLIARRLHDLLLTPQPVTVKERFLPGRMGFAFAMGEEEADIDVPTAVDRSKADCPEPKELIGGGCPPNVCRAMDKLYSHIRHGTHKRRKKKKEPKNPFLPPKEAAEEAMPPPPAPRSELVPQPGPSPSVGRASDGLPPPPPPHPAEPMDEEDVDIFEDAGKYDTRQVDSEPRVSGKAGQMSYFGTKAQQDVKTAEISESESLAVINQAVALAQARKQYEDSKAEFEKHQADRRNAPRPEGAAGIFHNPDMDTKAKPKATLPKEGQDHDAYEIDHGYSFDPESMGFEEDSEDDEVTLASKQFGIKQSDGRMSKKQMEKKNMQKIKQDLNKINTIIEKRKRGGDGSGPNKRAHIE